jgi:phage shock protein PspC (stress-responsive transcriptional regulator)
MRRVRGRRMLMFVSGTEGQHMTGVEDTLKDFWATRPRRPRRGRKLAGVAAGIGNRYGIDPIVIRVGFVVATFYGGAGVLIYLLGWLLLPEQDDEAAPFESMVNHKRSSSSRGFTILLCLALIPASWFFVDNQFSGIVGLLIVLGALYLLHRTRGHIGRPASTAPPVAEPPSFYEPSAMPTPMTAPTAPVVPVAEPVPTTPPAWDPLGAAPFAWDLPEPSTPTPEPPEPRRRSKAGLFTVGAALVTVGILAVLAPYAGGWLVPHHFIGILLAVIGLGMVGGAFVRGGRGLIGLAVPLSVIGIGLTVLTPEGWHGAGDINEHPTSIADVRDAYRLSVGQISLDLSGLPALGSVDTNVRVDAAGQVTIIVPPTADVEVSCKANLGEVKCLNLDRNGSGPDSGTFTDYGDDGPGGLQIHVKAKVGTGQVEVRRG